MSAARVVMVSAGFYPALGGAERQALELSKALRAQDIEVVVLTRRLPGLGRCETVEGVGVRRLWTCGSGFWNSISFMLSCGFWLWRKRRSYGAVHVHLGGSPALAAALVGWLCVKPVVVKIGGGRGIGEIAASRRTLAGRWKWWALRVLSPLIIAVTEDMVLELRENGLGDLRTAVIPNGVEVRRFQPCSLAEKSKARRELGLAEGLCFLYVGRLAPEKQLDKFIPAFLEVLEETKRAAVLFLVGSGPEEASLRALAQRLVVKDSVRFFAPVPEIEKFYAVGDVFVLPSVSEGLSNALLESMASGLAVAASRVGGTREVVEEDKSGLLFDPADVSEMKHLLKRLLTEPGLVDRLGRAARGRAVERYGMDGIAQRYRGLYGFSAGMGAQGRA